VTAVSLAVPLSEADAMGIVHHLNHVCYFELGRIGSLEQHDLLHQRAWRAQPRSRGGDQPSARSPAGLAVKLHHRYELSMIDDYPQHDPATLIDRRACLGHVDRDYQANFFGIPIQLSEPLGSSVAPGASAREVRNVASHLEKSTGFKTTENPL
jgi:hypothetical protein